MRIGFIGLGHMGGPMALNVLRAGHEVTVYDMDPGAASPHLQLGGTWASSPSEAAARAEILVTMLPGPRQVESVLLQDGAAQSLPEGSVWVDMSTSTPEAARRVGATSGIRRMDAPVSGMAHGATNGSLQIFAGGDAATFAQCRRLLEAMGDPERIFHVGGLGAGYTVKLMVNLLWFSHLIASAEVLTVGVKAGVELEVLRTALVASPASSHLLEQDVLGILDHGDYDESFAMVLACKDLGLAVDLSRDIGVPVELSALVEQIYRRALARFGDLAGEMVPVKLYEEIAGVELRRPPRATA